MKKRLALIPQNANDPSVSSVDGEVANLYPAVPYRGAHLTLLIGWIADIESADESLRRNDLRKLVT